MNELRELLLPYYLEIKTVHVLAAAIWSFSTLVAYRNYVLPAFTLWQQNPQDPRRRIRRDEAIRRFDRGVLVEHIAFPLLLLSGLAMMWLGNWPLDGRNWFSLKIAIVVLVFLPMEIVDYHISHFGGSKQRSVMRGDKQNYEQQVKFHWLFFRITTPIILVLVPAVFYLAIAKPL